MRAVGGGAVLLAALAVVCAYGWRWGFSPLPAPLPDTAAVAPPPQAELELGPGDYWYWVRELERTSRVNRRDDILHGWSVFEWAQTGHLAQTNRAGLARFFDKNPAITACFQGALSSTNSGPVQGPSAQRGREMLGHARLIRYTAWLASESEQQGRPDEALSRLLDGLRLCVRSGPSGLTRAELALLSTAWRRLALEAGPLDPAAERQRVADLAGVIDTLPRTDAIFIQSVSSQFELPYLSAGTPPVWGEVSRRFRQALAAMGRETILIVGDLFNRLMGGSGPARRRDGRGIRHLVEPLDYLLQQLQQRLARREDLIQVRDAYLTQVVAALRSGDDERALERAEALRSAHAGRTLLRRLLDRPSAWRSLGDYAPLRPLLDDARAARATLESCRLTLALRLHRDRHGGWPDRLVELVPDWLDELPVDPYTGRPFLYQHEGKGWLVLAANEDARAPEPADEGILFHSAEPGEARLLQLINGQGGRLTGVMDVQLLQRYGVLPKGLAGFLSQMSTNHAFAQALSALVPAVSDLRTLIRLGDADPGRWPGSQAPRRVPE